MKTEKEKMLSNELYNHKDAELTKERNHAYELTLRYNQTKDDETELRTSILQQLAGKLGNNVVIKPPFQCDYGYNLILGDNVFMNYGCSILDCNVVEIGNNVLMAPNVQIYAAYHPTDHTLRLKDLEYADRVKIGDNTWIGGGSIILNGVTDKIVSAIHPYLDTPYLVFGHSLGAKISYEVCNELREKQDNAPCHLIVSGSRAPHIPEPEPLHHLQDVDFIEAMKRYSGMSKEFLENRDLLNLFLPIFRADFILDETYCFTKYEKFDFPITALYGDQDQDSEIDTVEAWSEYTNTSFNKKVFHGEHFFIKTSEKEVLAYIKDIVSRYV